ncbi:MAG TPA: HIT domain-containing protein [Candidatus Dojkabacteria bacterium]|nr:HIT domain-containing protein [Candidatus Dojkabacteria bacterium]
MDDCIFCKIVKGDIPSFKIYEDENFLAILDIAQFTEGHTIVIPKKHFRFVWDVDNIDEYFKVAQKIANHFKDLGYEYVDTYIWGRMVPHAHVHLVPHNGNDVKYKEALKGLGELQSDPSRKLTKEKGEEIALKFHIS